MFKQVLVNNLMSELLNEPPEEFELKPDKQEDIDKARGVYRKLKEQGLNLIVPRESSLDSDSESPQTLLELLTESSVRLVALAELLSPDGPQVLTDEDCRSAGDELDLIHATWVGFMVEAREAGDNGIALFINREFIDLFFISKGEFDFLEKVMEADS